MISRVVFNGKNLADFGVRISGTRTYGAPSRSVTYETVPGRNGDLVIDDGVYNNLEMTYTAMIHENFKANIRGLRDYLLSIKGYARLEDTYSPDTYYMACFSNAIDLTPTGAGNRWAQFDLTFNRKPQRFLKSGEQAITLTADGTLYNPTLFDAKPYIKAYGTGTLTVNGVEITITGSNPYIEIDCDLQDAYYMDQNMNSYVTVDGYDFPVLSPGENEIELDGITSVIITPKWWHL